MNWYKKAIEQSIVSFDFDNTIFAIEWDEENNDYKRDEQGHAIGTVNGEIKNLMGHFASQGSKVIIVTSRKDEFKQEVVDFVAQHNLPVSEIYCTNGQDKIYTLKSLGVNKHFDDDPHEISMINQDGSLVGVQI